MLVSRQPSRLDPLVVRLMCNKYHSSYTTFLEVDFLGSGHRCGTVLEFAG
jgi:hypothetical protein